jgi:hypothetical protein
VPRVPGITSAHETAARSADRCGCVWGRSPARRA